MYEYSTALLRKINRRYNRRAAISMRLSLNRFLLLLVLLVAARTGRAQNAPSVFSGHVVAVTAGDTMSVRVGGGWIVTVRLHGLESPDKPPALRETVTQYTARLVQDTDVRVEVRGTATRSVVYGEVYPATGGTSVNIMLARNGLAAWASLYAPDRNDIRIAENEAQNERRGIWSVDDGAHILLPPSVARMQKVQRRVLQTLREVPKPVSPTPIPRAVAATPHAIPSSAPASVARPLPLVLRAPLPAPFVVAGIGFIAALMVLTAHAYASHLPRTPRRFAAQCLIALLSGGLCALVAVFPAGTFRTVLGEGRNTVLPLLATMLLPGIGLLLLRFAAHITRAARRLRGIAVDPRTAAPGFVKLHGTARSLGGDLVASDIGNLPALYVREISARYTVETLQGKRLSAPRWQTLRDTLLGVDFELFSTAGDGTGSAIVLAAQDDVARPTVPLRWLPYHVARFYNEMPTTVWRTKPYEGDTRTEIYFVPDNAMLTVWGKIATPVAPNSPPQVTGTPLLVVDGAEERAYRAAGIPPVSVYAGIVFFAAGCSIGAGILVLRGGTIASHAAVASLALTTGLLLLRHLRHAAWLARNGDYSHWEEYQHRFPGALFAPAFRE